MDPIVPCDDLDLRATHLQELVQGVMDRHTYALEVNHPRSALPPEALHAIWLRRKLRRRWQRTRDPGVKRRFQAQSLYVQQLLRDVNSDRWDSYLESLEVDHASVWRAASRLTREKRTRNPLETLNGVVSSSEGKAEVFADCMEVQFTVHQGVSEPVHSAAVRDFLSGRFSRLPDVPALPFDRGELVSSICRLNHRRAPGPDRIGAAALQNLPASGVDLVLELFNYLSLIHI